MSSPTLPLSSTSYTTPSSERFRSATPQSIHASAAATRVGPLRVSSPRLFHHILSSMPDDGSRRHTELPPGDSSTRAGEGLGGPFSLAYAIGRASQAVANAGEAFQSTAAGGGEEVVDLTSSPGEEQQSGGNQRSGAHADYLSFTTHPSDPGRASRNPRPLGTLHEPIFGYRPIQHSGPPDPPEVPQIPPFLTEFDHFEHDDTIIGARNHRWTRPAPPRTSHPRTAARVHYPASRATNPEEDRNAVRRQQENHAVWQRTQARARELQRERREEEADSIFGLSSESQEDSSRPSTSQTEMSTHEPVDSVDLTEVEDGMPIAEVIRRQRAEQIVSQQPDLRTDTGRTSLTAFKCPICMDELTDATVTTCGHLFCHRCLIESLKASAAQRSHDNPGTRKSPGLCPVCRKVLGTRDTPGPARTLIPLELKVLRVPKRKRDDKGKGRADTEVEVKREVTKRAKRETSEEFLHALLAEAID